MKKEASSESVVTAGVTIRGRLHGVGDVTTFGTVLGPVSLRGRLTVGEGGAVRGDEIEASSVVVSGEIEGDVHANGDVAVRGGALLRGHVRCKSVTIDESARVSADFDCDFDMPEALR